MPRSDSQVSKVGSGLPGPGVACGDSPWRAECSGDRRNHEGPRCHSPGPGDVEMEPAGTWGCAFPGEGQEGSSPAPWRRGGAQGRAELCARPLAGASLVVQQQHDRVQLPAGPVVGSQRHDEVVQPVARRLGRHDNQLVLEAVGLGVLVAVVPAALQGRCRKPRWLRWQSLAPLGPGAPGRQPLGPGPLAACTSPTRLLCAGLGLLHVRLGKDPEASGRGPPPAKPDPHLWWGRGPLQRALGYSPE